MTQIEVNQVYLTAYAVNVLLQCMHGGFALGMNNQVGSVLAEKLGWQGQETIDLNNTLISSSSVIGLMIGSLMSSKILTLHRR
jgi:hypothetical protein